LGDRVNAFVSDNIVEFPSVRSTESIASGRQATLTIDRFDHWSNPGGDRALTMCQCITVEEDVEAA
jgi:hypothetical protein